MQKTHEAVLLAQSQGEEKAPCFQKMRNTSNPASPLPADVGNSPTLFVKYGYCTRSLDLPILTIRELHVPGTHSAHTEGLQSKVVKCYSAFPKSTEHFCELAKDTSNARSILAKPLRQTLEVRELLRILEDEYAMK